ncbi:uncharacterized protein YcaQ [Herbihabitans rhizosphaerae]|uniref:Uncharacterized protein YcaQ n=1 Tax=Herbihabitans rhizosphaerae TaxID=1872711 RepID=A0A4Q7KTS1_9PSEU|nr:winged helix DNA-binding domain-containing protein [Herbihabitans rhizosphaerae]RZS39231.1 uncharacterized protein YcaQ [Herbihabitans rhizosphaerae]
MGDQVLDRRSLGRATLERQLLIRRERGDVVDTVERIGGLNAQQANDPYLALASRLDGFQLDDLTTAIEDRALIRSIMVRGTQHLVSVADYRRLRPVLTPLFTRMQRNTFGRRTEGVDLDALVAEAREILAAGDQLRPDLGRLLAESRPGSDANALGWSIQYLLPVVHPAPCGIWDTKGSTPLALAESIVGEFDEPDPRDLVRSYLGAFGPATVSDLRAWSGAARLAEVVKDMDDELAVFRDEKGRAVFDLPDAPRPDRDTPVPVRLLAGFDNVLLAYHDRGRFMSDEVRKIVCVGDLVEQTVLVDGVLTVEPFAPLSHDDTEAVTEEGARLLELITPDATSHDVRLVKAI